jgi:hypothetical protein
MKVDGKYNLYCHASTAVDDILVMKHGRWKTNHAKDGYVKENILDRLSVTKTLGI